MSRNPAAHDELVTARVRARVLAAVLRCEIASELYERTFPGHWSKHCSQEWIPRHDAWAECDRRARELVRQMKIELEMYYATPQEERDAKEYAQFLGHDKRVEMLRDLEERGIAW